MKSLDNLGLLCIVECEDMKDLEDFIAQWIDLSIYLYISEQSILPNDYWMMLQNMHE